MAKNYSQEIAEAIISGLNSRDLNVVDYDKENGVIQSEASLNCSLEQVCLVFDIREDMFLVYGFVDEMADKKTRKETAEYITRVNFRVGYGNFEMNMATGEVSYKCTVDCDHITPSEKMVIHAALLTVHMFEQYGDGLRKVMAGEETAKAAMDDVEANMQ